MIELFEKLVSEEKINFGELRKEKRKTLSIVIEDGKIESVNSSFRSGVGMRVLKNGWAFSSVASLEKEKIKEAWGNLVKSVSFVPGNTKVFQHPPVREKKKLKMKEDFMNIKFDEKKRVLSKIENFPRSLSHIVHTRLIYQEEWVSEAIVNSLGFMVEQEIPRLRVTLFVVAEKDGVRQSSYKSRAGTGGFEIVRNLDENFSLSTAKRAIELLDASSPPSGTFPVIISPEVSGLLAHEALGHNLEADHIIHGQSLLKGKLGERIASEHVTLIDDATYKGAYGSYPFDSEGVPSKRKILLKEGKILGFLHNLETSSIMGASPTGNGRAQNYHFPPLVRMSNTFFSGGEYSLEEMIGNLKEGIIAENVGSGGYVLPESGQFMFNIDSSWLVKNGKKKKLLRNVSLSGFTLETLLKIKAVSRKEKLSRSGGTCGKEGQGVPVDDGGPYMLVEGILVGGRS